MRLPSYHWTKDSGAQQPTPANRKQQQHNVVRSHSVSQLREPARSINHNFIKRIEKKQCINEIPVNNIILNSKSIERTEKP
jgi:hypothetical protein